MIRILITTLILLLSHQSHSDNRITEITISCEPSYQSCEKNGTGLYFDIVRAVFELEGIKVNVKTNSYKRGLKLLKDQMIDAEISGVYKLEHRTAIYHLPDIRLNTEHVVATRLKTTAATQQPITGTVNFVRGYSYDKYLAENTTYEEVTYAGQAIRMLVSKRTDYFLNSYLDTLQAIHHLASLDPKLDEDQFDYDFIETSPYYIAFQKNVRGKTLAGIYDKNFAALYQNGAIKKLFSNYTNNILFYYYPEIDSQLKSLDFETSSLPVQ